VLCIHRPYIKRRNRQQRAAAAAPFAVRATTLMHSRLFRLARSRWISGANSHLTLDAYILYPYTTAYSLLYFFFYFPRVVMLAQPPFQKKRCYILPLLSGIYSILVHSSKSSFWVRLSSSSFACVYVCLFLFCLNTAEQSTALPFKDL
jgi:hypothetical protein